jgi:hypothetical protein
MGTEIFEDLTGFFSRKFKDTLWNRLKEDIENRNLI